MTAKYLQKIRSQVDDWLSAAAFLNSIDKVTLFWMGGGGEFLPKLFFSIAQKLLGVGSWNFLTFSINV